MSFHPDKCVQLPVTRSRKPLVTEYHLHGHTLDTVASAEYLGVTIARDLSWSEHINKITAKANKTLGFLRRNLKISSKSVKEIAFKTFVRPVLEYAAPVWDPHTAKETEKLEKIQRRAARFVLRRFRNTSSVTDMLSTLQWPSLQERRRVARLTMLFKIKHGLAVAPHVKQRLKTLPSRARRGHKQQLERIPGKAQYHQCSFLPRTIRDWNRLSQHTVEATTTTSFVARVRGAVDDSRSSAGSKE